MVIRVWSSWLETITQTKCTKYAMNDLWTSVVLLIYRVRRQMVWQTHPMYRYHVQSCPAQASLYNTGHTVQDVPQRPTRCLAPQFRGSDKHSTTNWLLTIDIVQNLDNNTNNMKLCLISLFLCHEKEESKEFLFCPSAQKNPSTIESCMKSSVQILYFHDKYRFFLLNGTIISSLQTYVTFTPTPSCFSPTPRNTLQPKQILLTFWILHSRDKRRSFNKFH